MKPLDEAIDNIFIPALFGSEINENERNVLSLPINDGGMGLRKVTAISDMSLEENIESNLHLTTLFYDVINHVVNFIQKRFGFQISF